MSHVPEGQFCAVYVRGFPLKNGRLSQGFLSYKKGLLGSAHYIIGSDPSIALGTREAAERLVTRVRAKDPGIDITIMVLRSDKYHGGLI